MFSQRQQLTTIYLIIAALCGCGDVSEQAQEETGLSNMMSGFAEEDPTFLLSDKIDCSDCGACNYGGTLDVCRDLNYADTLAIVKPTPESSVSLSLEPGCLEVLEPPCTNMIPEQGTLEHVEVTSTLAGQPVDEKLWIYRGWAGFHCMPSQTERLLMLRQVGNIWAVTRCFNLLYADENDVPRLTTPNRQECIGQVYPTLHTIESLSNEAEQYIAQPDSCGAPIPSQQNIDRCIKSILSCNRST